MERMSFIPGREAREEIEDAEGYLTFTRDAVLPTIDNLALPELLGHPDGAILHGALLASLGIGDKVEIYYGLQDYGEGSDPGWDGSTWATVTESSGRERKLWEVGRETEDMDENFPLIAFNLYRATLGHFQGVQQLPEEWPYTLPTDLPSDLNISHALSPLNLYNKSGVMFYFVVFSSSVPSQPQFWTSNRWLSRPMRAFDALLLSALMTLAVGAPPLVFAIFQNGDPQGNLGAMPQRFERVTNTCVLNRDMDPGTISIIL